MVIKYQRFKFYKEKKSINFEKFMKKYNLKIDTMNEFDIESVYNYHTFPRDSTMYSYEVFVNIDNGSMMGTHWTCFIIKDNKSFYFDSFRGAPDKFLLNQLSKLKIYHNYKIQDINSKLRGSYCLYFFYLIERMNLYDTILEMCFD